MPPSPPNLTFEGHNAYFSLMLITRPYYAMYAHGDIASVQTKSISCVREQGKGGAPNMHVSARMIFRYESHYCLSSAGISP